MAYSATAEEVVTDIVTPDGTLPAAQMTVAADQAYRSWQQEQAQGSQTPSLQWRRQYSVILGLERLLAAEHPALADGTQLNEHQVQALEATLTALLEQVFTQTDDWQPLQAMDEFSVSQQQQQQGSQRRFWFEHATGSGKTVSALGLMDACRSGGVLVLTHRHALVNQFEEEIRTRGYGDRLHPPILVDEQEPTVAPITVATYQWFVRHAGQISDCYQLVVCDEVHQALGKQTSQAIRQWWGPIWVGMTATGALLDKHVAELFPTQTSAFDVQQAADRNVIAPLRCLRIPPGPGVDQISRVAIRKGTADQEFDQDELAQVLDHTPFNMAFAALYAAQWAHLPGVVYTAGVQHATHVAQALVAVGVPARAVSGKTPRKELQQILADYEAGALQVLVNAQLLTEGWNSPRTTICVHLAPTASARVYQQRIGRVTRHYPGKESGIVVDFVRPDTGHDSPQFTLHRLLHRPVYGEGQLVVGKSDGGNIAIDVHEQVVPLVDSSTKMEPYALRTDTQALRPEMLTVWGEAVSRVLEPPAWESFKEQYQSHTAAWVACCCAIAENSTFSSLRVKALQQLLYHEPDKMTLSMLQGMDGMGRQHRLSAAYTVTKAAAQNKIAPAVWWEALMLSADHQERWITRAWSDAPRLLGLIVANNGKAHHQRLVGWLRNSQQQSLQVAAIATIVVHPYDQRGQQEIMEQRQQLVAKHGLATLASAVLQTFPQYEARQQQENAITAKEDPAGNRPRRPSDRRVRHADPQRRDPDPQVPTP